MRIKNLFFFFLSFLAVAKFCHWQTGGFTIAKICTPHPSLKILASPSFTFLGSGKQFVCFESPDHTFVIKFLKTNRRKPLPWLAALPLPPLFSTWRDHYLAKREHRLIHLHQSAQLALQRIPFQTALVQRPIPPIITLIDKLGIAHTLSTAQTIFFVQQKADSFTDYFNHHLEEARSLITSYMATILAQCRQGLCNLDPLTHRNYGVINHRVVILDIGSFLFHPKLYTTTGLKKELFLELLPLRHWLADYHPEHLPDFDASLQKVMREIGHLASSPQ
jgi:hypothetical protein